MQSHDFPRAVEKGKLPEHWEEQHHREAKYYILNK
jgi:hypothetical protein